MQHRYADAVDMVCPVGTEHWHAAACAVHRMAMALTAMHRMAMALAAVHRMAMTLATVHRMAMALAAVHRMAMTLAGTASHGDDPGRHCIAWR